MFTGLIEEVGKVIAKRKRGNGIIYRISSATVIKDVRVGDSINISGVCQTVIAYDRDSFEVEAVAETLKRTNIGELKVGDKVNLERSMKLSSRLGGHLVMGHIDCVGKINKISPMREEVDITISYPPEYGNYLVMKGSVAVEGISLTVADVSSSDKFSVSVIPHTLQNTNLVFKKIGNIVNIEFDLIAKYVEKMFTFENNKSGLTLEKLKEKGWFI